MLLGLRVWTCLVLVGLAACTGKPNCPIPPEWELLINRKPSEVFVTFRITIEQNGMLRWNGQPTTLPVIVSRLKRVSTESPLPFLKVVDEGASCRKLSETLREISNNYPCKQGACALQAAPRPAPE